MASRVRAPLFLLLKVSLLVLLVVVAAGGSDILVYSKTALPRANVVKTLTSPSICGCRVRCFVMPICTAVTAHSEMSGISCAMTNESQPQKLLTTSETAVSFVKASEVNVASMGTGEFFLSKAQGNDGSHCEYYCSQESGVPASLSTVASITGLKASDMTDDIVDINADGVWVYVKNDAEGRKLFYNSETIVSARSGITFSEAEAGTCMRLKVDDVLATANCAHQTGMFRYACMKKTLA